MLLRPVRLRWKKTNTIKIVRLDRDEELYDRYIKKDKYKVYLQSALKKMALSHNIQCLTHHNKIM